jgi:hypothetical protein
MMYSPKCGGGGGRACVETWQGMEKSQKLTETVWCHLSTDPNEWMLIIAVCLSNVGASTSRNPRGFQGL